MEWDKLIGWLIMIPYWGFLAGLMVYGIYKAIKDKSATAGIVRIYKQFFGNLYSAENKLEFGNIILGIFWLSVVTFGLSIAFRHLDYYSALSNVMRELLIVGVMALAYYAGKFFSCFYSKRWANYLIVYFGISVLTLIGWAGYGTHTEDADPLFGGGYTVADFTPTNKQRSDHAGTIFFSLIPAALFGVYRGQNNAERNLKEVMAAIAISESKSVSK
jgi:hypothetical protein